MINLKGNPLSEKQINEIHDMNIKDRVELIRYLFLNNVKFSEDYKEIIGLENIEVTPENMEYFLLGATAIFDETQVMAANHWHGNEEINEKCEKENEYMLESMDLAFEKINPKKMYKWKELSDKL